MNFLKFFITKKKPDETVQDTSDWTHLKLWRKGYENLREDEGLTQDVAESKSVMQVIDAGKSTMLQVTFVERKQYARFRYHQANGLIEAFTLRQDELKELDGFNIRARYIGYNDVEIVFMAPRSVVFKRADAKEWVG